MTDPFRQVRDEAFQRLIEEDKESYTSTLESFDVYAERLKAQLHASHDQYLEHLQHGYDVIIQKIASGMKPPHK